MQFFQKLFGPKNPTETWVRDPQLRWHVDLDAGLFCGVPIGATFEQLQRFGPAQLPAGAGTNMTLMYPTAGFSLFLGENQTLETVDINTLAEPEMVVFQGRWVYQNRNVQFTAATSPAEIRALFADRTPLTNSETHLSYNLNNLVIMFEWDEGQLENIILDITDEAAAAS